MSPGRRFRGRQIGARVHVFRCRRAELPRGWVDVAVGSFTDVVVERERMEAMATRSRDGDAEDDYDLLPGADREPFQDVAVARSCESRDEAADRPPRRVRASTSVPPAIEQTLTRGRNLRPLAVLRHRKDIRAEVLEAVAPLAERRTLEDGWFIAPVRRCEHPVRERLAQRNRNTDAGLAGRRSQRAACPF